MLFINALIKTFISFVYALVAVTTDLIKAFITTIIKLIVKVQFLPVRIQNAMHIYKLKRELSQQIKEQLNK